MAIKRKKSRQESRARRRRLKRSRRRRHSPAVRTAVLADVAKLGVCGAAKKHKVPQSCVSRWRERADRARAANSAAPPTNSAAKRRPAKRYTPSEIAETVEYAGRHGVTAASEKHGRSRFSIYAWMDKVSKASQGQGSAPTTGSDPSDIEAQRDREILNEWHKHPGLGPSQIRNQLRRKNIKTSVTTVRRVMEEAGYRPPKTKRRHVHDERFEATRPNHIWHLDFLHRYIHRASTFSLILIDDYSRYVVGHGVDEVERADFVIAAFEEAVQRHGKPEFVLHDKGAAFWSWRGISRFTALITEMGIDQITAESKELNGKLEVFNANLHKEFFDAHRFYDVAEMRRRLATHLSWYNHARTHHALGGLLVPADRYYGRAEEVLARIESGQGRDLGEELELRERCLDLFRIMSRDGQPEVWLLGQKIFGAKA